MTELFPDPLVVMALSFESQGVLEDAGIPVLYTGLGKVNATYHLTRRLADYRNASHAAPRILNFGTAGSPRFATGALVECRTFVQRDIDLTGLGFAIGVTPYEDIPIELTAVPAFMELPQGTCGSGDSFATGAAAIVCDVIDMEAYALAKVAHFERLRFTCVKYITDGADAEAGDAWRQNLHRAAIEFVRLHGIYCAQPLAER
jgi:adenosylhomocysteine nucleosidase